MSYIPDNYDLWEQHESEKDMWLQRLPKCSECGEAIQDEYAYYINDEWICEDCLKDNYRKEVPEVEW